MFFKQEIKKPILFIGKEEVTSSNLVIGSSKVHFKKKN